MKIPGQARLLSEWKDRVESNRIPHTTLVSGPNGTPLLAVAHQMAIEVIRHRVPQDKKAKQMIHPDLHWSFPVRGSDKVSDDFMSTFRDWHMAHPFSDLSGWAEMLEGKSGAFNLNVKECTLIQQKLALKSFENGPKIILVYGAEYLGQNGNRLLKLLEEPPEDTYIILVTEQIQNILPTILSRCQHFKLQPIPRVQMEEWLIAEYGVDENQARQLVEWTEGDMAEIDRLQKGAQEKMSGPKLKHWIDLIRRSDFEGLLNFSNDFRSLDKEQQLIFLRSGLANLRRGYLHSDSQRIFEETSIDLFDLDIVESVSTVLNEMLEELDRNAHSSMMMMSKSIELWKDFKSRQRQ